MKKNKVTSPANNLPKNEPANLEKLTELETRAAQLQDKLTRSLADYSNLEKRIERDRQLFAAITSMAIISKMIDVLDDLQLAYTHLADAGLKMAIDKFVAVLKSEGLAEIVADNQKFDPVTMDCVDTVVGPENQVVSVKKPGYTLHGQVVRPASVIVGRLQK